MRSEPKLNLQFIKESIVFSLNQTFREYKKAVKENLDLCGFNSNGEFWVYAGVEDRNKKIKDLGHEIGRLMYKLEEINKQIEWENQNE